MKNENFHWSNLYLRLLEASYKAMKITKVSYLKLNIMNV